MVTGQLEGTLQSLRQLLVRKDIILGIIFYLAIIVLLTTIPHWFPNAPDLMSASRVVGYNNQIAYTVVIIWSIFSVVTFIILEYKGNLNRQGIDDVNTVKKNIRFNFNVYYIIEIAIVFLISVLIYFPTFLSKYGPYIEDNYFLSVLHRMVGSQRPYVDFETVYGPLMIYLPYYWSNLTGFSMVSYYSLIAIMEAVQFTILIVLLQRWIKSTPIRLGVFILLSAFLFNTLLGISWNGLRRVMPVFIILIIADKPDAKGRIIISSILLGLLLVYSHEFGIACLIAILAIYGLKVLRGNGIVNLWRALSIIAISILSWFLFTLLILGNDFPEYLRAAYFVITRFSREASFPFYWTVNSLATFGLLCLALVLVGRGLGKKRSTPIDSGDFLLFSGLVYALIGMRSGLNRADMWHLAAPMLVLIFAFVLPLPKTLFSYAVNVKRLAIVLISIMAITYLLALTPSGSYYASGLLRGFRDTLVVPNSASPTELVTRAPSIEFERSYPNSDVLELGNYLADPNRSERPVVLYDRLWSIDKHIGVYKSIYPTDDFLLSDQIGYEVRDFLQGNENAFVVMYRYEYDRVFGLSDHQQDLANIRIYSITPTKRILSWLSTVHYFAAELENIEKAKRWDRTVGTYIRSNFKKVVEFGDLIVLEQNNSL